VDAPALAPVSSASAYPRFAYSYAGSAKEAYAKEWRNFIAFGAAMGSTMTASPASGCSRSSIAEGTIECANRLN